MESGKSSALTICSRVSMTVIGVTATVQPESFHLISFSRMGSGGRKKGV